jgi:hypothetical protein
MTNPPYMLEHLEAIAEVLNHERVFSFLHIPVQVGAQQPAAARRSIGSDRCVRVRRCSFHASSCGPARLATCPHLREESPHLRRDCGAPHPYLRRDWAHRCHICAGTGLHVRRRIASGVPLGATPPVGKFRSEVSRRFPKFPEVSARRRRSSPRCASRLQRYRSAAAAQAASNSVLDAMKREYTIEQ